MPLYKNSAGILTRRCCCNLGPCCALLPIAPPYPWVIGGTEMAVRIKAIGSITANPLNSGGSFNLTSDQTLIATPGGCVWGKTNGAALSGTVNGRAITINWAAFVGNRPIANFPNGGGFNLFANGVCNGQTGSVAGPMMIVLFRTTWFNTIYSEFALNWAASPVSKYQGTVGSGLGCAGQSMSATVTGAELVGSYPRKIILAGVQQRVAGTTEVLTMDEFSIEFLDLAACGAPGGGDEEGEDDGLGWGEGL